MNERGREKLVVTTRYPVAGDNVLVPVSAVSQEDWAPEMRVLQIYSHLPSTPWIFERAGRQSPTHCGSTHAAAFLSLRRF